METRTILISGGTGFIGQAMTKALLKKNYKIKILTRSARKGKAVFFPSPSPLHPEGTPSGQGEREKVKNHQLEIIEADITRPETLRGVCDGVDFLIQCAQFPGHPVENRRKHQTYFEVDALGTENLAKEAKKAGVKHILYISGAGTDPHKLEPWYKAKWYAEQAINGTGIPSTILRPSWVYGPTDKTLNKLLRTAKLFPLFPMIGSGGNHVRPIFVDDLAAVATACVETASDQDRIFDVGGPEEMTMKEMLRKTFNALGRKCFLLPVPKFLVKCAAFFLQFLPGPPLNPGAVDFVTMDVRINIQSLKKSFPEIEPRTLEEGLRSYLVQTTF